MQFPSISHHGGTRGVTGSCHQLHLDLNTSLLVDCGLEQGAEAAPGAGSLPLGFEVQGIQALVITHVHLDHVGRIPALLAAGYRGPILCSEPSAKLLPLILEDAYKLAISSEPAHVARYLEFIDDLIVPVPFGQWHRVVDKSDLKCQIRLQRAGHLLGSAYVECDIEALGLNQRIVFSGDLGHQGNPLLQSVQSPERADVLVLESTYGDRLHPDRSNRQQLLEQVIDRALQDRGTILIPAFSLGRTQELLFELEDILHRKALLGDPGVVPGDDAFAWSQLPIILDSPLAQRITAVYRQLHGYWNDEAKARLSQGRDPLGFGQLVCVDTHARHRQVVNYLKSTGRPAIVIAGNGMCSGGRIVGYLKAMLVDPRHEVVFVGYQAKGTPGAVIQASEGAEGFVQIDLDGGMYEVRAKVVTLGGYSGHADQVGLVRFAQGCNARRVVLVHGERKAKQALARVLRETFAQAGNEVVVTIAE
ncbi:MULTISPECIES: MBL fold metallo-hydrolase RNA specificity domain-containing protein [Pseudomonas]|uniref:MBL fold metallo-hydrolase RNA specificity domain-containing protein n=1 Tax=Pseudomonas TaxID=286 RepID=UPI0002A15D7D|nr:MULTISPECIES: MBL fold metallo-hydrolase [Pseudomonas]AGA72292.1 beta-lactamase domain-containing protein [Pseudomonas putida HB3267]MCE0755291.1 MBL fold metallo-hydrolase [Pseudomonas asiatica]MCE0946312.1 MBL fold metallo-hydrolase [Pseudomonas asiatica]MCE0955899.1 MBL fold metallo-hydrolase [Pseudomonas asiatica]MCE1032263.1 MBL fold metallo-hydrolase [Pseudomonas asiatica]